MIGISWHHVGGRDALQSHRNLHEWVETHVFMPKEPEVLKLKGGLGIVVAVSDCKGSVDLKALTNTLVAQLHTLYQDKPDTLQLPELEATITSITNKHQAVCSFSLAVVVIKQDHNHTVLKLCGQRGMQAKLVRQQQLLTLPVSPVGVSGQLRPGDVFIVGTSNCVSLLADSKFKANLLKETKVSHYLQKTCFVHQSMLVKGLVFEVHQPHVLQPVKNYVSLYANRLRQLLPVRSPRTPPIDLGPQALEKRNLFISKKRRYALGLALLFLALLSVSVGLGLNKRKTLEKRQLEQQLVENVTYRLQQASSLKELNPARAKTLLVEARHTLEGYEEEEVPVDIQNLQVQVDEAYAAVVRQFTIRSPEVFYDIALVKENFSPSQMTLAENELVLLDDQGRSVVILDIETKSAKVFAGNDLVPVNATIGSISSWIFLASNNSLQILDKKTGKQLNSFTLSKVSIDELIGYGSNAYVLDRVAGQVWRFRGTVSGLAKPEGFFDEPLDLQEVVSLALDGSLWVLYRDGGVEKYTSGVKDAYYPSFDLDIPLNQPQKLYTDETCQNLYLMDKNNNRIVVVSKFGEYKGQYLWEDMKQTTGFAVSEKLGKLLLLSGGTIYGIDLQ